MTTPGHRAQPAGTHTREIVASDPAACHAAALVSARAFAANSAFRIVAGVRHPGITRPAAATAPLDQPNPSLNRDSRNMVQYFATLIDTITNVGGRVVATCVPCDAPQATDYRVIPKEGGKHEQVVSVAIWIQPNSTADDNLVCLRYGRFRVFYPGGSRWGLSGLWRAKMWLKEPFGKARQQSCNMNNIKSQSSCWVLENIATDPEEEGRGFASMLLREGIVAIERSTNPVCLLETDKEKTMQLYARHGWEVTSTIRVGKGRVDEEGFQAPKGQSSRKLPGTPSHSMIRLPGSHTPVEPGY